MKWFVKLLLFPVIAIITGTLTVLGQTGESASPAADPISVTTAPSASLPPGRTAGTGMPAPSLASWLKILYRTTLRTSSYSLPSLRWDL